MNKPILYASLLWSKLQNQINYFKEENIVALQVLSVLQKTEEEKQKESSNSSDGIFLFIMTFNQDVEPQDIPQIPTRRLETFLFSDWYNVVYEIWSHIFLIKVTLSSLPLLTL